MRKQFLSKAIALSMSVAMSVSSMSVYASDETTKETSKEVSTTSWKNLYESLGVTNASAEEGYYDVVTSATNFASFHAKDIPGVVNRVKDGDVTTGLDGVNLLGKEVTVTPVVKTATYTDSSKYGTAEFAISFDDTVEGYVWNDYISNLYAATISDGTTVSGAMPWVDYYGEQATSGPHYNKVQISLNSGESIGSNKAKVHRYDTFYDEAGNFKSGTYTVKLYSEGFADVTTQIYVADYEYMFANIGWEEYWTSEGITTVSQENSDSASNNSIKYVPVRVDKKDLADFKTKYDIVANDEALLTSEVACVNKTTNGLKTATKNEDGTFVFSAAISGNSSGLKDKEIKKVDTTNIVANVKKSADAKFEFIDVDLVGSESASVGTNAYAVVWKYFGDTDPSTQKRAQAKATYATKIDAKNINIEAGSVTVSLSNEEKAKLPENTTGTGYWQVIVKALGYSDTTFNVNVADENIGNATKEEEKPGKDEEQKPGKEDGKEDGNNKPDKKEDDVEKTIKVSKIVISGKTHNVVAGCTTKLTAKVSPSNAKSKALNWTSSNAKYAKVDKNGVVTALKAGIGKSVTITATAADGSKVKATWKINIKKPLVTKVKISGKKTVKVGKKISLKANVTAQKGASKKVKWTVSNSKYAKVNANGVVTGLKAGKNKSVTITAMATDGSKKKASIKIRIK